MKQKKYLSLAMAAVLTVSCSQNEVMEMSPDAHSPIGFKVYTGVQTRGTVMADASLKTDGFGILAYQTTGADYATNGAKATFMDNQQVTYATSAWTYNPLKFWPGDTTDKISFFAYAPYAGATNTVGITPTHATATADPMLTFQLQTNQHNMVDLVTNAQKDKNSSNGTVTFAMAHALTRVTMKAKTDTDISSNTLVKVYVTGVKIKQTDKLWSSAVFNLNTSTWAATSPAAYLASEYDLGDTANGILNLQTQTGFYDSYTTKAVDISTSSTGVTLFPANQYLFFIPTTAKTGNGTGASDIQVEIAYDILTKATASSTPAVSSTTKTVNLPQGGFKQGTAYIYTFTIGLNAISVNASVSDWGNETPGSVTVD